MTDVYCLQQVKGDSEWFVTKVAVKVTDVFLQIMLYQCLTVHTHNNMYRDRNFDSQQ